MEEFNGFTSGYLLGFRGDFNDIPPIVGNYNFQNDDNYIFEDGTNYEFN